MSVLLLALRLGWRNLWRNPRRSLITISAIAAAYAFLIGLIGLMEGLKEQLLRNGTSLQLGHLQVHDRAYLPDRNLHETIGGDGGIDPAALIARLSAAGADAAAPRAYGFGLLSTGNRSAGAQLMGVDPAAEARVTSLLDASLARSLEDSGPRSILLGQALAREIEAEQGTEVAVVTQAADGTLGNDLFRVAGIIQSGLSYLDRSLAVLRLADLQDLLVLDRGRIHEVAVRIDDPFRADTVAAEIDASGTLPPDAAAKSWSELAPQLRDYVNLTDGFNAFTIFLVALFAAFGVLNTMMMAVFERTREIGMMGSLGTQPTLILLVVLLESVFLAVLGLAAGFGGGSLIMSYMTTTGLNLSAWVEGLSMINTRMDPILKGAWMWRYVVWAGIGLVAATVLAAFLPARRAAWMNPVDALRSR